MAANRCNNGYRNHLPLLLPLRRNNEANRSFFWDPSAMNRNVSSFNRNSEAYLKNRPRYPQELYGFLFAQCRQFHCAWDCGCGNGQVSIDLVSAFDRVAATDINMNQVLYSYKHDNIHYSVQNAESAAFPDGCFDLLVTAQCLHWFDTDRFFCEAERVLKPGGVFGCWGYGFFSVNQTADRLLQKQLFEIIDPFWAAGNRIVQNGYRDISFPFRKIDVPSIGMVMNWNCGQLTDYLKTWSAVKLYNEHFGADVVEEIRPMLGNYMNGVEKVVFEFTAYCGVNG
jgi:SAM-dependent methyltransferase